MIYKAMFKCRLCGKIYEDGTATGNKDVAYKAMVHLTCTGKPSEPQAPLLLEPHFCKGYEHGEMGVADFIGWKEYPTL